MLQYIDCNGGNIQQHSKQIAGTIHHQNEYLPPPDATTGEVEVLNEIPVGNTVRLAADAFPEHIHFLELVYTPGSTNATVRTKMALDADLLPQVRWFWLLYNV